MENRVREIIEDGLKRKGISKRALARKCGFEVQVIQGFEKRGSASRKTIEKIAAELGTPIDILLIASKKFVQPRNLTPEQLEILSKIEVLPEPFQSIARKQIDLLYSLVLDLDNSEKQKLQMTPLRLVGKVGAGGAIENFPDDQREFDVPVELAKPNRYVLQVVGDSMTGVVNDGDYVVIEMGDVPVEGKVCVFRTENDGAVLKKWKRARGKIELISTNPEYQMKIVSGDLKCEGWLVDVVKAGVKP